MGVIWGEIIYFQMNDQRSDKVWTISEQTSYLPKMK